MISIKELNTIVECTPIEQPILLEGIHGVGKSEIFKQLFEKMEYKFIPLFLGQMSDAGDVLGLPERKKITINNEEHTVTEFCAPSWWPFDPKEKICIFLDELNRAKPEIHQVIMDMVLNRKIYNRQLPKNTRIVSAINPLDDNGLYQVEELDPALLDRFNKYIFRPSVDEWMDWGMSNGINSNVLGFISRNNYFIDPPNNKDCRSGEVYQSRRSWERVSNILNTNQQLIQDEKLLGNILLGIIGTEATATFLKYIREFNKDIYVGKIITKWDNEVKDKIEKLTVEECIHLNREIGNWFNENEELVMDESNKTTASKYTYNLENYLNIIPKECMLEFFKSMQKYNNEEKKWPKQIMKLNNGLGSTLQKSIRGEE